MLTRISVLLASLLVVVTLPAFDASAPVTAASAERLTDGRIRLTWQAEPGIPVDVYEGAANAPLDAMRKIGTAISGESLETAAPPARRVYFAVAAAGTAQGLRTAERLLPLQNGRNFRDLGGYPTADGRRTRWGLLYRSGVMARLSDADYAYLGGLGIRVICDLRSLRERTGQPMARPQAAADEIIGWDYETPPGGLGAVIQAGPAATEAMASDTMIALYKQMPAFFSATYGDVMRRLAEGDLPLAFNCTAGKDRTGVLSALILSALDVPRETIIADYLLTNDYVDYEAELRKEIEESGAGPSPFMALAPPVRAAILRADRRYIEAAFSQIEADHGSVDAYLTNALGLSESELGHMRENLTE